MLRGWHNCLSVIIPGGWTKTIIFIFVAPVMGFVLGFGFMVAIYWIFRNKSPRQVDTWFRKLQLLSAAAYSLGHGGNDAQKTMGIVAGALYTGHLISQYDFTHDWGRFHWPIILCANAAIAAGTYFGGWKIVHTMGSKITKLKPVGGFCAEAAGAITLIRHGTGRDSSLHHPHHHRSHRRRGHHAAALRRALGSGHPDCLGLGIHHPRLGRGCRHHLLPGAPDQSRRLAILPLTRRCRPGASPSADPACSQTPWRSPPGC